ncbi:beta-1,4-galactosyltransferase 4-like [Clavelina lepadiformis]|uniref:Beta-1,4-galactosyltransferase n=1 Tax=Clavelina lepadiformis TaxID=159417 RepID=A0ABP0GN35_CLALP
MSLRQKYSSAKGLVKRRTHHGLRVRWLTLFVIILIAELVIAYFRIHDVILVISLHLNIKLDWIRGLETNCQDLGMHGAPVLPPQPVDGSSPLPLCPETPPSLLGKLNLGEDDENVKMPELLANLSWVGDGGRHKPSECVARNKVAIIVPHRNREFHLRQFLKAIHPNMKRQQADYGVFVIQQSGTDTFNKAKLLNIGYLEALKEGGYDCFIFHDVDLLAEDDRNLYQCADVPRHLSVGIDKWDYQLPYDALFGGVIAMTKHQFAQVNGYSNEYWGWGAEDDDMYVRILHSCLGLERANYDVAKYRMIYHPSDTNNRVNPYRYTLLVGAAERQRRDGLNNIRYNIVDKKRTALYTNITADVGKPPSKPNVSTFGTGIDIAISISLLLLMLSLSCCTCFKSRLMHVVLCPRRIS